jgi:hypothetical protein
LLPYLKGTKTYPLAIDIALPVFSWMQVYQYNRFVGLLTAPDTAIDTYLEKEDDLWYIVKKDTVIGHLYLRIGDRIKHEKVSEEVLTEAVSQLKKHINLKKSGPKVGIAFFHLDKTHINTNNYESIIRLYTSFTE